MLAYPLVKALVLVSGLSTLIAALIFSMIIVKWATLNLFTLIQRTTSLIYLLSHWIKFALLVTGRILSVEPLLLVTCLDDGRVLGNTVRVCVTVVFGRPLSVGHFLARAFGRLLGFQLGRLART